MRKEIMGMEAELSELKHQKEAKNLELRKREIDVQRKKDSLLSS